jgi:hypothetical protein
MAIFLLWLLCGLIAGTIGKRKGEGFFAFIIGLIFGPFGIIFALISRGNRRTCPYCKELIHKDAIRCPHCQKEFIEINNESPVQTPIYNNRKQIQINYLKQLFSTKTPGDFLALQKEYLGGGGIIVEAFVIIILSLFFWYIVVPLLAIIAVWLMTKWNKKKKLYATAICLGVMAILTFVAFYLHKQSLIHVNESQNNTIVQKEEIKMLWDIPILMNKSHNQIVKILGNPTMIDTIEMEPIEYDVYYKQSDCKMTVCGNDLTYSYINPDQPVKYFFIVNYPITNPALSVAELKKIGNLDGTTTIKVIPDYFKRPSGMALVGIDICEKNYQGSEYEMGSEHCSK